MKTKRSRFSAIKQGTSIAPSTYTLTVLDRLLLLGLLPPQGDLLTVRIVRELREALSFTEAEHREFGFSQVDGQVRWNASAAQSRELEIGERARLLIVEGLRKLDKDKKLTEQHLSLWEMFIEPAAQPVE